MADTIEHGLLQSCAEELQASKAYRLRAEEARRSGDEETARLYEDIAHEEDGHYYEFRSALSLKYCECKCKEK